LSDRPIEVNAISANGMNEGAFMMSKVHNTECVGAEYADIEMREIFRLPIA